MTYEHKNKIDRSDTAEVVGDRFSKIQLHTNSGCAEILNIYVYTYTYIRPICFIIFFL